MPEVGPSFVHALLVTLPCSPTLVDVVCLSSNRRHALCRFSLVVSFVTIMGLNVGIYLSRNEIQEGLDTSVFVERSSCWPAVTSLCLAYDLINMQTTATKAYI